MALTGLGKYTSAAYSSKVTERNLLTRSVQNAASISSSVLVRVEKVSTVYTKTKFSIKENIFDFSLIIIKFTVTMSLI